MTAIFENKYTLLLLCMLFPWQLTGGIGDAWAECKLGAFHLDAVTDMPIKQLAQTLHDKTGCNFIFSKSFLEKKLTIVGGDFKPVSLINQLAKRLKAEVSTTPTVLLISPKKLTLKGTGKLVTVELADAPIDAVNQIINKLGSENMITEKTGSKITVSLYDVPLDDLVTLLEFEIEP